MILLFCSRGDESARAFAAQWAGRNVCALTCENLSRDGWSLRLSTSIGDGLLTEAHAVVDDKEVNAKAIRGVITRLPFVSELELPHIVAEDRLYVAAEMQAFLFAFLNSLRCPLLNRPSPVHLAGPNVRPLEWRHRAVHLGIPVCLDPVRISSITNQNAFGSTFPLSLDSSCVELTVVGERVLGGTLPRLHEYARSLARTFGIDFLRVRFTSGPEGVQFLSADLWPDLLSPSVAAAVFEYLDSAGVPC